LANVSLLDVPDAINISAVDVPDEKLLKMVKRAEVTLSLELGREPSMLANYVLALQTKTDKLSRYKASRRGT
jgi:hypothetical protein